VSIAVSFVASPTFHAVLWMMLHHQKSNSWKRFSFFWGRRRTPAAIFGMPSHPFEGFMENHASPSAFVIKPL
jgi:hypothetical protein